MYGSPKIHKPNVPLRPIISNRGAPAYHLAKWLASTLTPFLGSFSEAHVINNVDFINKLKATRNCNGKMISYDVVSLFTNVDLNCTLEFLERKLATLGEGRLPLPTKVIIDLIRLCVEENVFTYNGKYYKQVFGCAMGSPLSPVLSNFFMEYFESELLPNIINPNIPWLRYVDDIFSFCSLNEEEFSSFFNRLNSLCPSLKFQFEWEKDGELPFLDVLVKRINGQFLFNVFRKPTHSNSYIHFYSYHNDSVKISVLSSLFLRAYRICSPSFIDNEIEIIFNSFKLLGYPHWFIKKAHFKARKIFYTNPTRLPFERQKKLILPYIKENQDTISDLRKLGYDTIYKYPNTIGKFLVKNSPKVETNAGVYAIPCKTCKKPYIGESGRDYNIRLSEHKRAVRNGDMNNALFVHMSQENHEIDWNNGQVIYKVKDEKKRKIVEAAVINSVKNVNISDGFYKFDSLTTNYVIEAANIRKTIQLLNDNIVVQGDVT